MMRDAWKSANKWLQFWAAILGVATGIYFIYEKAFVTPVIIYEVVDQLNPFEVRQRVPEITISFLENDIDSSDVVPIVISINVVNKSGATIRKADFDDQDLWGIRVSEARIVRVLGIRAADQYIINNIGFIVSGGDLRLTELIFENEQSFSFDVLVAASKKGGISIEPLGKVAGIHSSIVEYKGVPTDGFFDRVVAGTAGVQVVRVFIYTTIFFAALFGLIGVIFYVSSILEKNPPRRGINFSRLHSAKTFRRISTI